MTRPLILLSNDDGVDAPGVLALRDALREIADVVTVAPKYEQSAQSHAISLHRPLRHERLGDQLHSIDGTPVDCVYVALFRRDLLPRRPDLCCSGINHGPNLASDVVYSGTVAAAREAALRGVPSIAFSLVGRADEAALMRAAGHAASLALRFHEAPKPEGHAPLLNVNFPRGGGEKGVRATRLGLRHYAEGVEVRDDPRGREYYWIGGPGGPRHEPLDGSDTDAVDEGFISVTPLRIEATDPDQFGIAAYVAGEDEDEA
ncbi:MAG TPA: 5'/3'-nucleotidase SurE [Polyangiaceae bacterium LLY-WYZ-15_(1-7)]|nr:5'/3'-nucleotidase SurE [Polyangiaceae bacterium LLY-WYZ-15_(1-7)]HJL09465.1 5'/3'-nucleotidase SurE [Polyangiaceae bacterium LLY-WYZ-15_(1-7)]HJL27802.1 5'/3'-nucleotidase SurE [Polyangiaceae bacterium LLY-WYZ-15_(1-7)]